MPADITLLLMIGLIAVVLHFGIPFTYFNYTKRYINKPWNIRVNPDYNPHVTIIVPTYNESRHILKKLDNLAEQRYSKEKIDIVIVDSASEDGTPELVRKWMNKNKYLRILLLEEEKRRGMIHALNYALSKVDYDRTDVIIFTDADSFWDKNTLKNIVKYFADDRVGAVTASITTTYNEKIERTYRNYYNVIRIGESKIHSTPIHNGALIAFKSSAMKTIGKLPDYTGNNDSTPASLIAFMGYRAIQIPEALVQEPVKTRGEFLRKVRRAQHLILHFINTKKYAVKKGLYKGKTKFDTIWRIEFFLNVVNPWLLVIGAPLFLSVLAITNIILFITLITLAIITLLFKVPRTWIIYQIILSYAQIRNIKTKDLVWRKI